MVGLILVSDSNEFVRALQKYVNQVSKISVEKRFALEEKAVITVEEY